MVMRKRPNWKSEKLAWAHGELLCGVDEVGTGAWAGPVYAGAVIFERYSRVPKLMDSKLLNEDERGVGARYLMKHCVWAVGCADVNEILSLGLRPATFLAMRRAITSLRRAPSRVAVDAFHIPDLDLPQTAVVRGDYQIASIAAAALIAKFHRDELMRSLDVRYPGYGFASHKGYGTKAHQAALAELGPCPLHRTNFAPLREIMSKIH